MSVGVCKCLRRQSPGVLCAARSLSGPEVDVLGPAQGILGSIPWNALVFFTLWLQLLGFTDFTASLLMATFTGGCALGQLLGGILGAQLLHDCRT